MQKRNNVQIVTRLSYQAQASDRSNEHDHPNSDSSPTSAGHGLNDCVRLRSEACRLCGFACCLVVVGCVTLTRMC